MRGYFHHETWRNHNSLTKEAVREIWFKKKERVCKENPYMQNRVKEHVRRK